jgi:hypothetical protein
VALKHLERPMAPIILAAQEAEIRRIPLEVGRKSVSLPICNGLWARGRSWAAYAYTCANSPVPQVHKGGNFHCSLAKDLQLKWGSLGSEGTGQGGGTGCCKSGLKKSQIFPNSSLPLGNNVYVGGGVGCSIHRSSTLLGFQPVHLSCSQLFSLGLSQFHRDSSFFQTMPPSNP